MQWFLGKTVVVTGGAGGIGQAVGAGFSAAGGTVILVDVAGLDEAVERTTTDAANQGLPARSVYGRGTDVTDPVAVDSPMPPTPICAATSQEPKRAPGARLIGCG